MSKPTRVLAATPSVRSSQAQNRHARCDAAHLGDLQLLGDQKPVGCHGVVEHHGDTQLLAYRSGEGSQSGEPEGVGVRLGEKKLKECKWHLGDIGQKEPAFHVLLCTCCVVQVHEAPIPLVKAPQATPHHKNPHGLRTSSPFPFTAPHSAGRCSPHKARCWPMATRHGSRAPIPLGRSPPVAPQLQRPGVRIRQRPGAWALFWRGFGVSPRPARSAQTSTNFAIPSKHGPSPNFQAQEHRDVKRFFSIISWVPHCSRTRSCTSGW